MKKLTLKEQAFVEEIQKDWNGTQAVIRAGYKTKNPRQIATQNLSKLHIQEALAISTKKHAENAGVTVEDVLRYWKAGMMTPIDEFYDSGPDGELVPKLVQEMSGDAKLALDTISVNIHESGKGYQSIKKIDGMRCSENLAKHFGIDGVQRSEVGSPGEFTKLSEVEQIDAIDKEQRRLAQATDRIKSASSEKGSAVIH